MTDTVSPLSKFVAQLSKDPLWKFAWVVFGSLVWFLWNFYTTQPEEEAQIQANLVQADKNTSEMQKAREIQTQLANVFSMALDAEKDFAVRTHGDDPALPSHESAKLGLEKVGDARGAINGTYAFLKTVPFENEKFTGFANDFAGDLEAFDEGLKFEEEFYRGVIANDRQFNVDMLRTRTMPTERLRRLYSALARVDAFQNVINTVGAQYLAENGKFEASYRVFKFKERATLPAELLAFGFIVAVVYRWYARKQTKTLGQSA